MKNSAGQMALGGMMAALAIVIMCLGGLIPVATYVCPMLCTVLLAFVLKFCGKRVAWAWYGAVSVLCLLLAPDREGAAVFLVLGYYPIVKLYLDGTKLQWLWKGLLFNSSALALYGILIFFLGLEQIVSEFEELGTVMTVTALVLGNVTFFLLDKVLNRIRSIS